MSQLYFYLLPAVLGLLLAFVLVFDLDLDLDLDLPLPLALPWDRPSLAASLTRLGGRTGVLAR